MIKDLIDIESIELGVKAQDWVEAIRKSGDYLINKGKITTDYVENVITAVKKLGPYIVIMPGVAFAHARPDSSVKETCMHMIRLEEPVEFGSTYNDPVKIIIMFAAVDSNEHIEVLQDIANLMMDKKNVETLM